MTVNKIVLLACGSFNPITNMHMRMFEIAKDHLHRMGSNLVIAGFISPVHDAYGKSGLVCSKHRNAMIKLALQSSDWIHLSDWETKQETWTRTRQTLEYHQNNVNDILNKNKFKCNNLNENDALIPEHLTNGLTGSVKVKLLCGADLLESFGTPGLWADEDLIETTIRVSESEIVAETRLARKLYSKLCRVRQALDVFKTSGKVEDSIDMFINLIEKIVGQHGLIVISRDRCNPLKFIYNSDLLTKYMGNITIVTEWIINEVSSTKVRRALRRSESVKYLIPDPAIDYIHNNGLYETNCKNKYLLPSFPIYNSNFLTPSPSDITMETPSPTNSNCLNLCNNNLFSNNSEPLSIDVPDSVIKINQTNVLKHPGQAVKIMTTETSTGQLKVIKKTDVFIDVNRKVCTETGTTEKALIKNSKSCTEITKVEKTLSISKSIESLDCKSCDENLIKFIFTKHGIQVISDVETIV